MVFTFLTTVNAMNKAAPVKEMSNARIVAMLVSTSNNVADVTVQGGVEKVKPAWNESSFNLVAGNSNNSNTILTQMIFARTMSRPVVMNSSSYDFSLNLTSTTGISPQPGSSVILKTELQGIAIGMVGKKLTSLTRAFMYSLEKNSKEGMVCRQKIWPNNANETSDFFNLTSTMPTCRTLGGNTFSSISGFTVAAISKV